ncbi:MAG: BON domain-containing protein, partial [Terriglobales bacterium]
MNNRTLWTAATAALLLALGMTACSSGKASTQDQALATAVEAKLKADPALAGATVDAAATNGVVTLTGTVGSEQARLQAAQDAQMQGVTQVNNQIGTDSSATTTAAAPAAGT